jgi:hypothetical protein
VDKENQEDDEADEMSPNVHCFIVKVKETLAAGQKVKVGTVSSTNVGVGALHAKET